MCMFKIIHTFNKYHKLKKKKNYVKEKSKLLGKEVQS